MRDYETVVVIHPDLGEAGAKELADRVRTILEQGGAQLAKVEDWGLRELAFQVQKQYRGAYFFFDYKAEHAAVVELERQLKLNDRILRFLSVRRIQKKQLPPRKPRETDGLDDGLDEASSV
ncbi:MAG: 30S ribosomal protein S6 [Candidatus Binatia bacterium]